RDGRLSNLLRRVIAANGQNTTRCKWAPEGCFRIIGGYKAQWACPRRQNRSRGLKGIVAPGVHRINSVGAAQEWNGGFLSTQRPQSGKRRPEWSGLRHHQEQGGQQECSGRAPAPPSRSERFAGNRGGPGQNWRQQNDVKRGEIPR